MLIDVGLDVLRRDLEFLEQRAGNVVVGKHVQKMLRVELGAAQLVRLFSRALQQFQRLLAEGVRGIDRFARHLGGERARIVGLAAHAPEQMGQPACSAQQRVERVQHVLVPQHLPVVIVTD